MKRRKTKAERDEQWLVAEQRVWEDFIPKLAAVNTFTEAVSLVSQAPRPDTPGRRYYSNLGFFLQAFTVPAGASYTELSLYIELIERIDKAGELKAGGAAKKIEDIRHEMAEKPNW